MIVIDFCFTSFVLCFTWFFISLYVFYNNGFLFDLAATAGLVIFVLLLTFMCFYFISRV